MKLGLLALFIFMFVNQSSSQNTEEFRLRNHPTYYKEKSWEKKAILLEEMLNVGLEIGEIDGFKLELDKLIEYSISNSKIELFHVAKLLSVEPIIQEANYNVAHRILIELEPIFILKSDKKNLGFLYRNLGICQVNLDMNQLALSSFKSSVNYFKEVNLREEYIHSEALSVSVMIKYKDYFAAEKKIKKCIKFMVQREKYKTAYRYYHLLATIYSATNKKEKEKWANQKSYDYALKSKSLTILALAQNNLAIVKYYDGNFNESIRLFHKALETRINTGQKKLICESYYNIASVYEVVNYEKAIDFYNKSRSLAKKEKLHSDEGDAIAALSELYKKQNDYKKVSDLLQEYIELKEKIIELNAKDQVRSSNKINAFRLESRKISLDVKMNQIKQSNWKKQWIIIVLASGYAVLATMFLWKRRRKISSASLDN